MVLWLYFLRSIDFPDDSQLLSQTKIKTQIDRIMIPGVRFVSSHVDIEFVEAVKYTNPDGYLYVEDSASFHIGDEFVLVIDIFLYWFKKK